MLQSIRDHTHGWIAGTIITLLILSFALWGIHSYVTGSGASDVVAKVNGVDITKTQLTVAYERLRRQLQMQFSASYELPVDAQASLKDRALQTLINVQVLQQASLDEDYRINSQQIDNFLQSIPEFQVNGEFSITRFQQALATTLFTPSDFLKLIKTTLLIDQPKLGILFSSYALPNEINNAIELVKQERSIKYLIVSPQYLANQPMVVSPAAIRDYYAEHQNQFKTPEQVSVDYITLSTKEVMNKINPSVEALKNFYNENSSSFTRPAEWQLEELLFPLAPTTTEQEFRQAQTKMDEIAKLAQEGKSFVELAKQYPATKLSDALQKKLILTQAPGDLQAAIATLTKPGQVSKPLVTSKEIVLLKVISYKEAQVQSYDQAKEKVKETFIHQHAEEKLSDLREKLANLTYEHPDSLRAAAEELGLTVQTTELFTQDKGGAGITASNKVREAAFSHDVLNSRNNSDVIQIDPEAAIVLRIHSHVPATLLSLEAVQNQIINKLKVINLEKKLAEVADEIQHKLQTGTLKPEEVSTKYQLPWHNVGFTGRHSTQIAQAILDAAFTLPHPQSPTKASYGSAKVTNGFAVIELDAVKNGSLNVAKEQYQAFAQQTQNSQGVLEYDLYKDSLMKNADIELES